MINTKQNNIVKIIIMIIIMIIIIKIIIITIITITKIKTFHIHEVPKYMPRRLEENRVMSSKAHHHRQFLAHFPSAG